MCSDTMVENHWDRGWDGLKLYDVINGRPPLPNFQLIMYKVLSIFDVITIVTKGSFCKPNKIYFLWHWIGATIKIFLIMTNCFQEQKCHKKHIASESKKIQ